MDKATFHINGCVNLHNGKIWGCGNPHVIHNDHKVKVSCSLMRNKIFYRIFFIERTTHDNSYLVMI